MGSRPSYGEHSEIYFFESIVSGTKELKMVCVTLQKLPRSVMSVVITGKNHVLIRWASITRQSSYTPTHPRTHTHTHTTLLVLGLLQFIKGPFIPACHRADPDKFKSIHVRPNPVKPVTMRRVPSKVGHANNRTKTLKYRTKYRTLQPWKSR